MSEQAPDRIWSGIDISKTVAGVLAAVTAAVVGSFLGAAGTLAGAAIASVVGSVGTEIYRKLMHRGQQKIVATFVTAPAAVGTPAVAAAADESPSHPTSVPDDDVAAVVPDPPRQIRWGRAAMVAASVFVLAMGVLTAFELISGKTAADAVGGSHSRSDSTLGTVFGGHKKADKAPAPAPAPSSSSPTSTAPSEAPNGSEAPTTEPSTSGSSATPSTATTETRTASPEPTSTNTQNSDQGDGSDQNNIAPPATPQPQGTE
jgi:hypothetical protein